MKILWVTNTIFPDFAISIGQNAPVNGGWMYGLAKDIVNSGKVSLFVATSRNAKSDIKKEINNITYFHLKGSVSINKYDSSLESKWVKLINTIKPDLVHIHGSEYAMGLSLMKACPNLTYILSIQGLISACAKHYFAGMSLKERITSLSIKDVFKRTTYWHNRKEFYKRGETIEKEYLKKIKNFIGRTQWDYSRTKAINPSSKYFFCNESLRDGFYIKNQWTFKSNNDYPVIFLSQASYPLKGLHMVLKALYLNKSKYPNIQLKIAGGNILNDKGLKQKLKMSSYGKYIKTLSKDLNLTSNIKFTGPLNETEMVKEYINASMFICPSSIENSPNSVGEAQLLGVPVISSYVGGIQDMIIHEKTGFLYRFEEVEMLATSIDRILTDNELALKLSRQGYEAAKLRHSRTTNSKRLLEIYHTCISKK